MTSIVGNDAMMRKVAAETDFTNNLGTDDGAMDDVDFDAADRLDYEKSLDLGDDDEWQDDFEDNQTVDDDAQGGYEGGTSDDGDKGNDDERRYYPGSDLGLNAEESVREWHICAVGRRPSDFLARDCLFGSMFRDYRVRWFHRYMQRPEQWMEELVSHLPKNSRRQALQYVVLHYLHKLHLTRLMETVEKQFGEDNEEMKRLSRLWQCPPYTVLVARKDGAPVPHCCGLFHLCPWCFARKVAELNKCIRKGVLTDTAGKYLVLAKTTFAEPFFGLNERYLREDLYSIGSGRDAGWVRDWYGRYYGLDCERAHETRNHLALVIRESTDGTFGYLTDGLLTHQMGSEQDSNGRRTYLHDIGIIGVADADNLAWFRQDPGVVVSDTGNAIETRWRVEDGLIMHGLVIPADHPSALRTVLAGTGWSYKTTNFGLDETEQNEGVAGALSWQPTFLLDDQVWFGCAEATRRQHLYRAFGSWGKSLASAVAESRETDDRRFGRMQRQRLVRRKQQGGNDRRHSGADQRRNALLKIAEPIWPTVDMTAHGTRGRPAHRSRLQEQLKCRGIEASRRDLDWLVKKLRGGNTVELKKGS